MKTMVCRYSTCARPVGQFLQITWNQTNKNNGVLKTGNLVLQTGVSPVTPTSVSCGIEITTITSALVHRYEKKRQIGYR